MRKKIYLSGPVEQSDDPNAWRNELVEDLGYYRFIDPTKAFNITLEDIRENEHTRYYLVMRCLRGIAVSDGVYIDWSKPEITWGTPIEQFFAWISGIPIVVYTGDNDHQIPAFMEVFADDIVKGERRKSILALERYI